MMMMMMMMMMMVVGVTAGLAESNDSLPQLGL